MDKNKQLKQEFELLESWTKTLSNEVKSTIPLIWEILESEKPLPKNCPSRGSLAELQFRDVTKALDEVIGARDRIYKFLLEHY
ncbi:hypothetical protein EH221_04380 [bacterium]|nr:MAG: hypothetical protein EH221_04380 [bacterium]